MEQSSAPVRGMVFYSVTLFLLSTLGAGIQGALRLYGVVLNELLFFLLLAVLFTRYAERGSLREALRLRALSLNGTVKSLFLGVIAWALAEVLGVLITLLVKDLGGQMYQTHTDLRQAPFLIALLVGALLPSIAEEVAFRGYLQWSLGPLGDTAAILLTGLLFGAMHFSLIRLLPLAALGWIFAAAVQRSGSILPGVIMHFLNNGLTLTLAYFYKPSAGPDMGIAQPMLAALPEKLLLLVTALGLGWAAWALARTFGPDDSHGPFPTAKPMPSVPLSWRLLPPLLPALLLYGWIVAQELWLVFGRN